jgi:hypothetical protein
MSDDQHHYLPKDNSWPIAIRFKYEFGDTSRHFQKFWTVYFLGAALSILFISIVTWFKKDAAVDDIPMIILASVVHLLRGAAIVSLLFAWVCAKLVHDWLYEKASSAWIEKEKLQKPGVSFGVPHWRFFFPAVLVRASIFLAWLGTMFFFLYVAPGWVYELERFIPDNFPI